MEKMGMEKFMHVCWNKKWICFFAVSVFLFESCVSKRNVPYEVFGEIVSGVETEFANWSESSTDENNTKLDFLFTNLSDKNVDSFFVTAFIFDSDGNSVFEERNNLVFEVNERVLGGESYSGNVVIPELSFDAEETEYEIEYIYVSKIIYEDGSLWCEVGE